MPRHPHDKDPDPPGGRAAERLRDMMERRMPGGYPPIPPTPDEEEEQPPDQEPENDGDTDKKPSDTTQP